MKPRSNNRKTGKHSSVNKSAPLSLGRKWLFRFLALIIIPLLLLSCLEVILRVGGYGHSYHFFKKTSIGGHDYLVNDDLFGLKFFPPEMTRSPSAFRVEPQKPTGVYRIFIFGESAAMGDPEPAFGPGRYLEMLLRERYPQQKFEIINVGITAINSHVILPIARECARQQGDLWIIYMGNNEMVGPFGAATVFGAQAPPVAFVRLSLALQETRVGQLLLELAGKLKTKPANNTAWGGMQMFVDNKLPPDDRRREMVYHNFERNLQDIVRAGLDSRTQVLLSTVAVNLKDCPPFASQPVTNFLPADATAFEQACANATKEEARGDFVSAIPHLESASKLAPQSADRQFELGRCELELGKAVEGRAHLQSACDLDTLPFRADSRINHLITQATNQMSGDRLHIFDATTALTANGACGTETFYEHVHFNFDGSYRLARAWAEQIKAMLPNSIAPTGDASWATQEICEAQLGLTDWNRSAVVDSVIQRLYVPPLSTQPGNAQRLDKLQNWSKALRARVNLANAEAARGIYLDALKRAPEDYYLHENYAAFLVNMKELPAAATEWRRVHELIPQDFTASYRLAEVLVDQNNFSEAEPLLHEALSSHPGFTEVWLKLGQMHALQSKLELALDEFHHAQRLRPQDPTVFYELGRALSRLNRSDESLASFREAIRLRPDYWEARYTLGGELGMHDKIDEARVEFTEVIRLKPEFSGAHLNLGVALMKQGQLDDAQKQFEEALRLDSNNQTTLSFLNQLRALKNLKH